MSFLVPVALFCWLPLTVVFFLTLQPHRAVLISVIGGVLFLPAAGYSHIPLLPPLTKNSIIAIALILGGFISGKIRLANYSLSFYDLPILVLVFSPIATSLVNDLGLYDGIAGSYYNITTWCIPYLAGRIYFDSADKLRELCLAIVLGGLLYLPLCLFEMRMSPQLSNWIYGFFPHSFAQHARYGGYRPIVFMSQGLMVSLWMALSTTTAFWLWRYGELRHVRGVPMAIIIIAMLATTMLCKSANGWIALLFGCGGYFIYRIFKSTRPFRFLLILVPCYILLRVTGILSSVEIESVASTLFDENRIASLSFRLEQEDLFVEKTLERPFFGWGGYDRGWPINSETGKKIRAIDALWLITFNCYGFLGVMSLVAMMLIGPWLVLCINRKETEVVRVPMYLSAQLAVIVILFMIDCLANAMINPVYILASGGLSGFSLASKRLMA